MFFDSYPEFIELDERKKRSYFPVSTETLTRRCESMLPLEIIKDKTILDIGSALGAMGHWALSNGSSYYCAVEKNDYYRNTSFDLLKKYHNNFSVYEKVDQVKKKYDVVIAAGVIHGFLDPIPIIKRICDLSKKHVIIETMIYTSNYPVIGFQQNNMINPKDVNLPFSGVSGILSKAGLDMVMGINGFEIEQDNINPNIPASEYGKNRYIMRYVFTNQKIKVLEKEIKNG